MKKILICFMLFVSAFTVNAMFSSFFEPMPNVSLGWSKTREKLIELGMSEEDLKPKEYPLKELQLTPFWKEKAKSAQKEKNAVLSEILFLNYSGFGTLDDCILHQQ